MRQRLLCGKHLRAQKRLGTSPCWLLEDTRPFFTVRTCRFLAAPTSLGGFRVRGAACRVAASRPPGPRVGEGEHRSADGGARRVGGGKGPSRKGRVALCGWRWEQPGLRHCYLRQLLSPAPRRPAPSRSRAARLQRPGKKRWCWRQRWGARSARAESRPPVSGSRTAEAGVTAARGHRVPDTSRFCRAKVEDQPGPGAAAPSLGCLRASVGRLGRFALPPHPPE